MNWYDFVTMFCLAAIVIALFVGIRILTKKKPYDRGSK